MKMNDDNHHKAVFSSPLPILLFLLVIILAFAGKLNASQRSTDEGIESASEIQALAEGNEGLHQDTEAGQYDRYYRTLIIDPTDDREKLVELRYTKDGRLTEVLIDDEILSWAERRKNKKIISKAMAEERNVGKEIEELVEALGCAMEETMGVISDLFVSGNNDKTNPEVSDADSSRNDYRPVTLKKDRKDRLTTLEELESGEGK